MSESLTTQQQQELSKFLTLLLQANASTRLFANFFNPITPANVGLDPDMFKSLDKKSRQALKNILRNAGVRFEGHEMTFPQNYEELIPQIVEEFLKQQSAQVGGAVAEEFPRAVCGGGGAAEAPSPAACGNWGSTGWGVPKPKDNHGACCAGGGASASSKSSIPCPNAGGTCKHHNTWGGCWYFHPENDLKKGKLPEKGGSTIMVCRNGLNCKHGNGCIFPHPGNRSCVVKETRQGSGNTVFLAKVCTLRRCDSRKCQCAHLPPGVVSDALERKKKAFSKSHGDVAHSAVAVSAVSCDDLSKDAEDESANLTSAFQSLSIRSVAEHDVVCCGGGACAGFSKKPAHASSHAPSPQPQSEPPAPSAPPLALLSSDENRAIGAIGAITLHNLMKMIQGSFLDDNCQALANPLRASCVVMCQALAEPLRDSCVLVRRRNVVQNDASVAPKASKRLPDSQSGNNPPKKHLNVSNFENKFGTSSV